MMFSMLFDAHVYLGYISSHQWHYICLITVFRHDCKPLTKGSSLRAWPRSVLPYAKFTLTLAFVNIFCSNKILPLLSLRAIIKNTCVVIFFSFHTVNFSIYLVFIWLQPEEAEVVREMIVQQVCTSSLVLSIFYNSFTAWLLILLYVVFVVSSVNAIC